MMNAAYSEKLQDVNMLDISLYSPLLLNDLITETINSIDFHHPNGAPFSAKCEFSAKYIIFLQSCGVSPTCLSLLRESRTQFCELQQDLQNTTNEIRALRETIEQSNTQKQQNICKWTNEHKQICGKPCRKEYCVSCGKKRKLFLQRKNRPKPRKLAVQKRQ